MALLIPEAPASYDVLTAPHGLTSTCAAPSRTTVRT